MVYRIFTGIWKKLFLVLVCSSTGHATLGKQDTPPNTPPSRTEDMDRWLIHISGPFHLKVTVTPCISGHGGNAHTSTGSQPCEAASKSSRHCSVSPHSATGKDRPPSIAFCRSTLPFLRDGVAVSGRSRFRGFDSHQLTHTQPTVRFCPRTAVSQDHSLNWLRHSAWFHCFFVLNCHNPTVLRTAAKSARKTTLMSWFPVEGVRLTIFQISLILSGGIQTYFSHLFYSVQNSSKSSVLLALVLPVLAQKEKRKRWGTRQ